jgi:hypothetical protein
VHRQHDQRISETDAARLLTAVDAREAELTAQDADLDAALAGLTGQKEAPVSG